MEYDDDLIGHSWMLRKEEETEAFQTEHNGTF
jgi:hypothetical protein